jgi:predicted glycogen debranching enzyme
MVDAARELAREQPHAVGDEPRDPEVNGREWLVTNGLGGYASGTEAGVITRRFHGILIAALPAPEGRTMMLNYLAELLVFPDGRMVQLGEQERPTGPRGQAPKATLADFKLEQGLPVWRFEHEGTVVEKRVIVLHRQNTAHVGYRLLAGPALTLDLEPWVNFRPHEGALDRPLGGPYALKAAGDRYEISLDGHPAMLRLKVLADHAAFTIEGRRIERIRYQTEASRGYDSSGDLYSPGYFRAELRADAPATCIASTEPWEVIDALSPDEARASEKNRRDRLIARADPRLHQGRGAELVLAADQFIITPIGRVRDSTRAKAAGDEVRTVIAGYPWFTDWGRDTMISLEGLALVTGRHAEAGFILRTFAHYVRDGLIPNMFPEGNNAGLYHTADATLWFFHAVERFVATTGDRTTLRLLLPVLEDIIDHHRRGTRFGIHVDSADGLLVQGQEGYALTWMDAKLGDLVITPRRGKAVEINALYYNALRLLERWLREERSDAAAAAIGVAADRARDAFNRRFWYEEGGYLYDVVDGERGDDSAFRPNQVLAVSLAHPVLDPERWAPVIDQVEKRLVTPGGLRSLAEGHPDYKASYFGDLRKRDMAYHQGTAWAWLAGPFIEAWLKVHPDDLAPAYKLTADLVRHLDEACVGSISEIFDAAPPYTPRGCFAQAWSVSETLRAVLLLSAREPAEATPATAAP